MELGGTSINEEERGDDKKKKVSSYYGCNLCKRGFTNAQALGGHMNIHRNKDKPKPPTKPKSKQTPDRILSQRPLQCATFGSFNSYMLPYIPSSIHALNPNDPCHLGFHGSSMARVYGDYHNEEMKEVDDGESLDLELRLGLSPSPAP